jgi:multidrug resistance efflux pump
MKNLSPVVLLFCILISSCSNDPGSSVMTFRLEKSDYIEKINVHGTVEAVSNSPVLPPQRGGQMTVVKLVQDGAYVKKGDTLCVLSNAEMESTYRTNLSEIEKSEAALKKTEADHRLNIALLEAQLLSSEAQLKISYLDTLKMKYAPEAQQKLLALQIQKAEIEKDKINKKLAASRKIAEAEIRQKGLQIMQMKLQAQSTASTLNSMVLIAQHEGMVQRAEGNEIRLMSSRGSGVFGGPVREGTVIIITSFPVLQFPDLSRMQISAGVSESEFRKVEKGQRVVITIDAAGKIMTTGRVNRKSLASSLAQRYSNTKVKSYEVIIDIDSCHNLMKPGLSADCEIILAEEKETFFVPSVSIFERDSLRVVYVKGRRKFDPVEVKTGKAGSSFTIIAAGLKGGEDIALNEPPSRLVSDDVIPVGTDVFENQ